MMATYRGERWVGEQIESILAQEGVDVTLRIRDDQSPDGTLEVCQSYAKRYPNVIVTRNAKNLGTGIPQERFCIMKIAMNGVKPFIFT